MALLTQTDFRSCKSLSAKGISHELPDNGCLQYNDTMSEPEKIFQVSEFNEFIDTYLQQAGEVVVEGEISEINISKNRWVYITLKDEEASVQVFGVIYKLTNARQLGQGELVRVYGKAGLYQKTGRFSLQADLVVPVGEGALQAMFNKLKEQLEKEGLFATDRKRDILDFPENIGLITAKNSQAFKDFVKVSGERMGGIVINFYPVNVQGKDSVPSIVRAFEFFNNEFDQLDALVIVRGGGSLEDLMSFNDEAVARAIFSSKFPVICGVGHEGDTSLADMVADVRASTPSNAAEILTRERNECLREVEFMVSKIENSIKMIIKDRKSRITHAFNVIDHEIKDRINETLSLIIQFEQQIKHFEQHLLRQKVKIGSEIKQISLHAKNAIDQEQKKLLYLTRTLKNMDYRRLLERGYSITTDTNGKVIKEIADVRSDDDIETAVSDGKILSVVK